MTDQRENVKFDNSSSSINVFAVSAIIALIACFQPIAMGYPQGHDWIFELVRIIEYHEAFSSGQGLPFWGADLYRGFGSPVFVFYAPLYVACVSLLIMVGLPVTIAAIAVFVFFTMIAAVGVAGLTREILGRKKLGSGGAALVASAAFVLAPYFLANMLVRNASAEFVALCLSPYPFWGLVLIYKKNSYGLPLLVVSFSAVILAHNLTGLTMAALLLVAILFLLFQKRFAESVQVMVAVLLALGLSCWFWLAALGLKGYVRIDEMLQGKFDFHNNFTPIDEMFGYGGLFATGWLIPVVLLIAAASLVRDHKNPMLAGLLVAGLLFVFLQTAMSTLVWESIPLLPLFQFPWRMLGPLSLVVAVMSGLLFHKYLSHQHFGKWIIILLIAVNAAPLMQQYTPLTDEHQKFLATSLNPMGIMQRGLQATVLNEYLPRTANLAVSERVPSGAVVLPGSVSAVPLQVNRTSIHLEIETDRPGELHVARWYFPGWHASLDGVEHLVQVNRYGAIKVDVPAGKHQVQLWLAQPALRQWGMWISSISVVVFALLLLARQRGWRSVFVSR